MHATSNIRVSPSALSVALLVCATLWLSGAVGWYVMSDSKDGWSTTPLLWMLILTVTPVLCITCAIALVIARRDSRFTVLDWCALSAASVAVLLGGLLILMVLSSMSAMGI